MLTFVWFFFKTQGACIPVVPMVVSVPHVFSGTPGESLRAHHAA